MGNYNIPKNRKKKYSSKRVTVDNPFLKLIAGLIVFGLGGHACRLDSFEALFDITASNKKFEYA